MIHQLKEEAQFFEDTVSGRKSFTVRKNDRCFKLGDFVAINEVLANGDGIAESGRCCLLEVTYILDDQRFVKDGYVILGCRPCEIETTKDSMFCDIDKYYRATTYNRKSC